MATLDEIMGKATPVERTVRVCVAGAAVNELDQVNEELAELFAGIGGRLVTDNRTRELQEKRDELENVVAESTYAFTFRAMSAKRWSDLLTSHPDPKGERIFNPETFPQAAIGASCVEPEGLDDDDARALFLETLSPAQQADLFDAAWTVNTDSPKGRNSSGA